MRKKSELNSKDRYEETSKIPCVAPNRSDRILALVCVIIPWIAIFLIVYLSS